MNLSPAYLKQREEWKQEGKLEGIQEGKLEGIQEGKLEGIREGKLEGRQEGRQEGIREGAVEGQLSLITSLLEGRFGALDSELSGLVAKIAQLPLSERTELLLSLSNLSREELITRLSHFQ